MQILTKTINNIKPLDQRAIEAAQERLDSLTKPPGSLGVLEDMVKTLAGITGKPIPSLGKKTVIIMAGDHGVTDEGVSAFPKEVTPQMVINFLNGGAAINVLSRLEGAGIICCDIGVASDIEHPALITRKVKYGTDNMAKGPAMSREEAAAAIETGIEVAEEAIRQGSTVLATGEMGIGNTTPSSAILRAFSDCSPEAAVGLGTGINKEGLSKKHMAINKALEVNRPNPDDPLDVLSKVGGLEIAGLTGVILAAAANRIPIVIDGFISTAAALVAARLCPGAIPYMIASHVSEEPGHRVILNMLGLNPILHMKMRLGEGTGAVLAFHMLDAAVRIQSEMATFADAGVSSNH